MNTKKIWLFAIVFGIIAAGMLYVMVSGSLASSTLPASVEISEEEEPEEKEEVVVAAEEEKRNEMLPFSEGNRAITVAVSDAQGVAGFITPGSFVDIVAVMLVPDEYKDKQHDAATLLLQNVKVLGIGHASDDEETMKRYQMVTFEVTPKEGLVLGFASKYELYLMLRQEGDNKVESNPDETHIHEDDLHVGVFRR
ncbi:Flp pilus assembly protein CpaB [Bacillus sp. JJ1532]|uniref:Flp pilus assembly protein CpaB n=1 Tax=unclassified Bacillus (in: firmicutes) TaxID=185979 RepID=UPI002FFF775C